MKRVLKAEWWEVWWVKPGEEPYMRRPYGKSIPRWIPKGGWPCRKSAWKEVKADGSKYLKVFHIKRYTSVKAPSKKGWIIQLRAPKQGARYYMRGGRGVTLDLDSAFIFTRRADATLFLLGCTAWPARKVIPVKAKA